MDPITIAALAGSAVDAGIGIWNAANQYQNNEYLKKLQKQQWERDDSAVQRRVNDLKAAGLSPVLASGQSANTSPAIRTEAPQINGIKGLDTATTILALAQQKAQIGQTNAQSKLTEMQANKVSLENQFLQETMGTRTQTASAGLNKILADTGTSLESKRGLEIANKFNEEANPKKLEQLAIQISNLTEDQKLKQIQQLQAKASITKTEREAALIQVNKFLKDVEFSTATTVRDMKLSKLDMELLSLQLANNLTRVQIRDTTNKADYFEKIGQYLQGSKDLTSIVSDVLGTLKGGKGK